MTLGDERSFPWRRALVTGASSGIGEALARGLARGGVADLVLVARRVDRLEQLRTELAAHGCAVEVLAADLVDPDGRATVEHRAAADDAPIDLLVNNAGIGTTGSFINLPVDGEEREVLLNVVAPLRLARAAAPGMVARGHGAILNVSSMACYQPSPGMATYSATKAFLTMFSETLHEELRSSGVTVTALLPGFTRTEFQDNLGDNELNEAPGFVWMSAESVADAALVATAKGRALCVPGVGYKIAAGLVTPLPRSARRWIMGRASAHD